MDQSRRSNLPAEQFILTELEVAETFITTAEATSSDATRNRCKANARRALDKLYLYVGHSTDPYVLAEVRGKATELEVRLARLLHSRG